MIPKTTRPLYRSSGSVALRHDCLRAGEPRHLGAESRVCARRLQALRQLHSCPPMVEGCLRQKKSDLNDACRSVSEQSAGQQEKMIESRRYRE
jgi:hypothetical protein